MMQNSVDSSINQIDFTHSLLELMQRVGISSLKSLCRAADVSEWQILQLRQGKIEQMRLTVLLKISKTLNISLSELIATFSPADAQAQNLQLKLATTQTTDLQQEYERLLQVLEQQREALQQELQQSSLQILESLLIFLPTAAQKARENPQEPAVKILTLVQKPLEKLLQSWGVEAIASVGAQLAYDPQFHELIKGNAQPGEMVKVSYVGYTHNGKLLYRAKVMSL